MRLIFMKKLLLIVFFIPLALNVMAQDTVYSSSGKPISQYRLNEEKKAADRGFDKSKLIFGGGFTFGAGNGIFNAGIWPIVGYRVTEKFSVGVGLGYEYLSAKNYWMIRHPVTLVDEYYSLKVSIYRGSIWARHIIWNNIFAHVEPEINLWNARRPYYDGNPPEVKKRNESFTVPRALVGGGIRQPIGDRSSLVVMVLYDVIQDDKSPYSPLDIRFGFNVGF
ncbi:MAG: hypothetical protein K0R82_2343 [Flavipsychrobacter sp.]|jgi:hypothetical protein|nr:hypothetical protein [Flavipsychrobacter sp.]